MRSVLPNGVVKSVFIAIGQCLRPIQLIHAAKDPSAIVFTFKHKDSFFMEHQQVDLRGLPLRWKINIFQNDQLALKIIIYQGIFRRELSKLSFVFVIQQGLYESRLFAFDDLP